MKKQSRQRLREQAPAVALGQLPPPATGAGAAGRRWTFSNTRLPLDAIFESIAGGTAIEEIAKQFNVNQFHLGTVLGDVARLLTEDQPRSTKSG